MLMTSTVVPKTYPSAMMQYNWAQQSLVTLLFLPCALKFATKTTIKQKRQTRLARRSMPRDTVFLALYNPLNLLGILSLSWTKMLEYKDFGTFHTMSAATGTGIKSLYVVTQSVCPLGSE